MKLLDETAKAVIGEAYDNLKRIDFLERLFEYIEVAHSAELNKINAQNWADSALNKLIVAKTKPGPRAKEIKENGQGELTGV